MYFDLVIMQCFKSLQDHLDNHICETRLENHLETFSCDTRETLCK